MFEGQQNRTYLSHRVNEAADSPRHSCRGTQYKLEPSLVLHNGSNAESSWHTIASSIIRFIVRHTSREILLNSQQN